MDWTPHGDVTRHTTKAGSLLSTVFWSQKQRASSSPIQGYHQEKPEAERHKDRLTDITITGVPDVSAKNSFGTRMFRHTDVSAQDVSAHSDLLRRMIRHTSLKLGCAVTDDSAETSGSLSQQRDKWRATVK